MLAIIFGIIIFFGAACLLLSGVAMWLGIAAAVATIYGKIGLYILKYRFPTGITGAHILLTLFILFAIVYALNQLSSFVSVYLIAGAVILFLVQVYKRNLKPEFTQYINEHFIPLSVKEKVAIFAVLGLFLLPISLINSGSPSNSGNTYEPQYALTPEKVYEARKAKEERDKQKANNTPLPNASASVKAATDADPSITSLITGNTTKLPMDTNRANDSVLSRKQYMDISCKESCFTLVGPGWDFQPCVDACTRE